MRPRVVAELNLAGLDQRPQQVAILRPRPVDAVDEIRQPHAGVPGELRVKPHHIGADAVVQGQRQQVTVTGDPAQCPTWQRDLHRHHRRWPYGFRCRLCDPRLRTDGAPSEADTGKSCQGQASKEVTPVQLGSGVGDRFAASHRQTTVSRPDAKAADSAACRGRLLLRATRVPAAQVQRCGTAVGLIGAGSAVRPIRYRSTPAAAARPSAMAHTISDCPRPMSPATNTPGTVVAKSASRATLPRSVISTPRSVSRPSRSGPTKPIANSTRSASISKSVPSTFSNLPALMATSCPRSPVTRPSLPVNSSVLTE